MSDNSYIPKPTQVQPILAKHIRKTVEVDGVQKPLYSLFSVLGWNSLSAIIERDVKTGATTKAQKQGWVQVDVKALKEPAEAKALDKPVAEPAEAKEPIKEAPVATKA